MVRNRGKMNRLDKLGEILKSYENRYLIDTRRFLLVLDKRFHSTVYDTVCAEGAAALIESAKYVPKQGVLFHDSGKAVFSKWGEFGDSSVESWSLGCALQRVQINCNETSAECLEKALSGKDTSVLALSSGVMQQDLVDLLRKHSESGNKVAIIEVSGIWPAGYKGHNFGLFRRTGSVRTLERLAPGYVRQIYTGEKEP